jgi:hypothetical protein
MSEQTAPVPVKIVPASNAGHSDLALKAYDILRRSHPSLPPLNSNGSLGPVFLSLDDEETPLELPSSSPSPEEELCRKETFASLSREAKQILRLFADTPDDGDEDIESKNGKPRLIRFLEHFAIENIYNFQTIPLRLKAL